MEDLIWPVTVKKAMFERKKKKFALNLHTFFYLPQFLFQMKVELPLGTGCHYKIPTKRLKAVGFH